MSFNIGENVGPYRIIEQLGQGGMATVYKAYHASLDRYVALKVLHPAFNQDQTFTMRFQREARVVARLEHTNIVPIYDYSEHEGRPYLVMKYIEGDTLKARLNQGPLTSAEIEHVVNSVGYALAYAHRQGILHRDIKPSNVMIATDGAIYLADFGLARIAEAGESTMSSDSIMGTPQYISPEQAMGKKDLDAGTDIYSFGVMLYEMVVGRVPFTADTPFSIIHDHIYTPLPLPTSVNPNVPESVQRVLLKSLAKDRADRYATVEELIKAFKDAWTESGVPMQGTAIVMRASIVKDDKTNPQPQADSQATKKLPEEKKKRAAWRWAAGGALSLICCAVVLFAAFRYNRKPAELPVVASPMPVATQAVRPTQPPPPPGNQNPPSDVQIAIDEVAKDPRNPDAHLRLSLALWDAKELRTAFDEMTQAANLADPNKPDFFLKAAEEYTKREAWTLAASMYMRVAPIYKGGEMPEDLQNNLRESVYKASEKIASFELKFFDRLDNFNQPLAHLARGRHALYSGKIEEAKRQLEQAKKIKPDMPEASLFEAEIAMKEGDNKKALDIFTSLSENNAIPEWIRRMADSFLKSLR
ncbi:MAG: protein kinase [Anaerolineales bacterium]|nr:protein kinase [Anaerolineales bacterium]